MVIWRCAFYPPLLQYKVYAYMEMHIMVVRTNVLFSGVLLCPGLALTARMIHAAGSPLCSPSVCLLPGGGLDEGEGLECHG